MPASHRVVVRAAEPGDDATLQAIDVATWTSTVSPAPAPEATASFFASTSADEILVAEVDGQVAGYVQIGTRHELESSAHVLELKGLAIEPARQRQGIGRLLVDAAIAAAKRRNARRLALRVLGSNAPATALYERCGFTTEGILREQFLLDGRYVDDVFMALDLNRPS